jgi:hypothetical protein
MVMRKTPPDRMVMVYNAEDGFFNALTDWAHKVFSPATYECTLCRYTVGLTGMLSPWKSFIELQSFPTTFLHRTEFRQLHPQFQSTPLPVILVEKFGKLEALVTAEEIKASGGLMSLINLMQTRLELGRPTAGSGLTTATAKR